MQGVATRYDSLEAAEAAEAAEALQRSETTGTGEAAALARMRARQAAAKAAREATNGVGAPPLPAVPELRPEVSSERLAPPSPSQPQASLQPVSQATAEPGPETAPDPELQEPEDALFQFLSPAEREAPFAPGSPPGSLSWRDRRRCSWPTGTAPAATSRASRC